MNPDAPKSYIERLLDFFGDNFNRVPRARHFMPDPDHSFEPSAMDLFPEGYVESWRVRQWICEHCNATYYTIDYQGHIKYVYVPNDAAIMPCPFAEESRQVLHDFDQGC